ITRQSTPAGSTWQSSRSACCAVSVSTGGSASTGSSSPRSPPGKNSATVPTHASSGCSPQTRRATSSPAPILIQPMSHNQCAAPLVVFLKRPGGQAQFSAALALQAADGKFGALHDWINNHLDDELSLSLLAEQAARRDAARLPFSIHAPNIPG